MRFTSLTLLLLCIEALAGPAPPPHVPGDIVDTGYAKYLGNRAHPNTVAYLGIPYAEPPLGERRFRAPLPLNTRRIQKETKGKIVDATKYPDFCVQASTGGEPGGAGSEDCLKVNVYAPVGAKKNSKLPVLFYIHGGGYAYGNPEAFAFEHWINQSPNVVIVSVYYRLAALGFLAHPEMANPASGDLNAGFLDQIEALRWVKKNIASFGGDPSKVTINGESAGGSSVELHMVSSLKDGLFSGAIAQSVYRHPLASAEQLVPMFSYFTKAAGCGEGTVQEQLACLRRAPLSALARAQDSANPSTVGSGYARFTPMLDRKTFVDFPSRIFSEGKMANIPLIVGATTNETLGGGSDIATTLKGFFPSLLDSDVTDLEKAYPAEEFASPDLRYQALIGDAQLKCANPIMAKALAVKGTKAFTYRYNQRNPTNGGTGVWHASENWHMFKGVNTRPNGTFVRTEFTPTEEKYSRELIAYWLSFVRTGDPSTHRKRGSTAWPVYTPGDTARIVLQQAPEGAESGSVLEKHTKRDIERCDLVLSQVERQRN